MYDSLKNKVMNLEIENERLTEAYNAQREDTENWRDRCSKLENNL